MCKLLPYMHNRVLYFSDAVSYYESKHDYNSKFLFWSSEVLMKLTKCKLYFGQTQMCRYWALYIFELINNYQKLTLSYAYFYCKRVARSA